MDIIYGSPHKRIMHGGFFSLVFPQMSTLLFRVSASREKVRSDMLLQYWPSNSIIQSQATKSAFAGLGVNSIEF